MLSVLEARYTLALASDDEIEKLQRELEDLKTLKQRVDAVIESIRKHLEKSQNSDQDPK